MRIFRGYIPVRSKDEGDYKKKSPLPYTNPRTKHYISDRTDPVTKKELPDEEWLTLKEIEHYDGYAGLLTGDFIVIDVDNEKESSLLLNLVKDLKIKCKAIKTSRGIHFYFKKPSTLPLNVNGSKMHATLRIGIEADFLFATDDPETKECLKEKYIVLKLEGEVRPTIYETDEIGDVPYFLFPMPKKYAIRFSEMKEGKRNNTLLTYQINLAGQKLDKPQIRETIKIINKYILSEPLDDSEIEIITRTEAVQGAEEIVKENKFEILNPVLHDFFNGKRIKYDKYAKHLIDKLGIIKKDDFLYIYEKGIYKKAKKEIENFIATEEIADLTYGIHNEIKHAIDRNIKGNSEEAPNGYIALQNGYIILDEYNPITNDFQLHKYNKKMVFTQYSPVNYDPNADPEPAKQLMMTYANGRQDMFQLLCEMVGFAFLRGAIGFQPKCFIITGNMNNGKTTFFNIITALLGKDNVSAVPPQKFEERFALANLDHKLANIVNDLNEDAIEQSGIFKEVVDGTPQYVENKGEDPYFMTSYATNIFACNNIPRIKDDSLATKKRLFIIPFDKEFTEKDMKTDIETEMTKPEVLSGFLNLVLPAIKGVIDRKHWTKCQAVEELTTKYASGASSIIGFIEECKAEDYEFEGKKTKEVFERFTQYCIEYGIGRLNLINFSRKLCKVTNLETKAVRDGFSRVYVFTQKMS